jgi:hypothetical protein
LKDRGALELALQLLEMRLVANRRIALAREEILQSPRIETRHHDRLFGHRRISRQDINVRSSDTAIVHAFAPRGRIADENRGRSRRMRAPVNRSTEPCSGRACRERRWADRQRADHALPDRERGLVPSCFVRGSVNGAGVFSVSAMVRSI